ncbi:hypothetical protein [Mesorhizobium sp. M0895]|uniref:nSTAND1 domain-containing NTPase n=1 Tax=Mesorhizobium sp. M0895 TaxID=2957019 RepID=UPI00333AF0BA
MSPLPDEAPSATSGVPVSGDESALVRSHGDESVAIGRDAVGNVIVTGQRNNVQVTLVIADQRLMAALLPSSVQVKPTQNPYRGLDAFYETDGAWFFGRNKLIRSGWLLIQQLLRGEDARILAVVGASGSGKSSLVRAGLLPELARQPMEGLESPKVLVLRPGNAPLRNLAEVIARLPWTNGDSGDIEIQLATPTQDGTFNALHRLSMAALETEYRSRLIIVVDQFEELFTECEDSVARTAFLENLAVAASASDRLVSIVLTLRSDFTAAVQTPISFANAIVKNRLMVRSMDRDELRSAIEDPTRLVCPPCPWPAALVDNLISQAEGRAGALPLLQFALQRLWIDRVAGHLDETLALSQLIEEFLVEAAEILFASTGTTETERTANQALLRRAFVAMVQLGEGSADTRRVARLSDFSAPGDDSRHVHEVLTPFMAREARLVSGSEDQGEASYEIIHEALISSWDRLRAWLGQVPDKANSQRIRSDLRLGRRLAVAAAEWRAGRGGLWRPPELQLASSYAERSPNDITSLQDEFLSSSQDSWTGSINQERTQFARMKHMQRRTARFQWLFGLFLQISLVVLVVSSISVWSFWLDAMIRDSDALATIAQQQTAKGDAVTGQLLALEALRDENAAEFSQRHRPWVERAYYALDYASHVRREIAFLYAEREAAFEPIMFSYDGKRVLSGGNPNIVWDAETGWPKSAWPSSPYLKIDMTQQTQDDMYRNAMGRSQNRRFTFQISSDGTAILYDVGMIKMVASTPYLSGIDNAHGRPAAVVSNDGRYVIIWKDHAVAIWNTRSGDIKYIDIKPHTRPEIKRFNRKFAAGITDTVHKVLISADATTIVVLTGLNIMVIDTSTGVEIKRLDIELHPIVPAGMAMDSTGRRLFIANYDRWLITYDTSHWELLSRRRLEQEASVIEITADSNNILLIYYESEDHKIEMRSIEDWSLKLSLSVGEDDTDYVDLSPDEKQLITRSHRTARLWNLEPIEMEDMVRASALGLDSDGFLEYSPIFSGKPKDLVLISQQLVTRCLTPRERRRFNLSPSPQRWCIDKQKWPMPFYDDTRIDP